MTDRNQTPERVTELLAANNALLERARTAEARLAALGTVSNPLQSVLDRFADPMTAEEIRLEDLKQMAQYAGPIVSFEVAEPYYLASCDHCGWVGSTELCGTDSCGDDSDVYCPRCYASGADCGKVAARLSALETTPAPVSEMDGPAVSMIAPPCRVCGETKWVAIWSEEKPKETICIDCCHSGEHEHANGETGHEFDRGTILSVSSCIHCGMGRS